MRHLIPVLVLACSCGLLSASERELAAKIYWETDIVTAFQKAIDSEKPMCVFFVCPTNQEKCVHCKRLKNELGRHAFAKHNQDAVFVVVENRHGEPSDATVGEVLAKRLEIRSMPAMSVIEPNPKKIVEIGRTQGFFNSQDLAMHFSRLVNKWRGKSLSQ